jgi:starch synthase
MKVAFIASEALPFAKTGGLADVVGALPSYLDGLGCETYVILPKYRGIQAEFDRGLQVRSGNSVYDVRVCRKNRAFFIDYPPFFDRENLYGTPAGDYEDNCERFALFCRAAVQVLQDDDFDIIHCHDWQSALVPLFSRLAKYRAKSVFTIHNLGYQGRFHGSKFDILNLDRSLFTPDGVEFYGDINLLKAGLLYSDWITTVSQNYAREIQTPQFGCGLDGVLRMRSSRLSGIINGIDYGTWDPRTDRHIYARYQDYAGKRLNKTELAHECDLDANRPLIGMVSRVAGQKGFDLLAKTFDEIIWLGFNFILLGVGEKPFHDKFKKFEEIFPGNVSVNLKFDDTLAHRIYAGSDFFLMPSRYEPCGLGQLISMKYGTVPVVHKVGGLADTVQEYDAGTGNGNGIVFDKYTGEDLLAAVERASFLYRDAETMNSAAAKCMDLDYSWNASARKYMTLYENVLAS